MNDESRRGSTDELVERALHHRRAEEPRPGLEQRVLAHVQEARPVRRERRWKLAAAAAVLVVPVGLVLYLALDRLPGDVEVALADPRPTPPVASVGSPAPSEPVDAPGSPDASTPGGLPVGEPARSQASADDRGADARERAPIPQPSPEAPDPGIERVAARPGSFPSQRALTTQEALLVRYLQTVPGDTLKSLVQEPAPLRVEKLSMPRIRIEPLLDVPEGVRRTTDA